MDAGVPERALCLGGLVVFELKDSEVYVPIGQVAEFVPLSTSFFCSLFPVSNLLNV